MKKTEKCCTLVPLCSFIRHPLSKFSSSILRMLDHCYPQNVWYLDFYGELSLSVFYSGNIHPRKFTSNGRFFVNNREF